jgi:hypothetical protein
MVAGCALEGTLFSRVFALGPLPALGRVSYALYLVHWPIFLVLTEARVGFGGVPLFAVRVLFSLGVALLMFRWIEGPARRNLHTPRAAFAVLVPAAVVVCVLLFAITPSPQVQQPNFAAALHGLSNPQSAVPTRVTALMFGDSTALTTGFGLGGWGTDTHELRFLGDAVKLGCGVGRVGERDYAGVISAVPAGCDWSKTWARLLGRQPHADVAIVEVGPFDVTDRKLPGDDTWRAPGDPKYDRYLLGEMNAALDLFHADHMPVVWLSAPHIDVGRAQVPPPAHPYPASDPARTDRFNALVHEAAAGRPDVAIVDVEAHLRTLPDGDMDATFRPDGVHFTLDTARVFANWLGPQVVDAVQVLRTRLDLPAIQATATTAAR